MTDMELMVDRLTGIKDPEGFKRRWKQISSSINKASEIIANSGYAGECSNCHRKGNLCNGSNDNTCVMWFPKGATHD